MKALLKSKLGKLIFGLLLLSIGMYILVGSWMTRVNHVERKINAKWSLVKQNCDKRTQMLPQFSQIIQSYAPQAEELISTLNQSYMISSKNNPKWEMYAEADSLKEFSQLQSKVVSTYALMQNKTAQFPSLIQNRRYLMLKMELQGLDEQINAGVNSLNKSITDFNRLIEGIPQSWANTLFLHQQPKQQFTVSDHVAANS